MGIGKKRKYYIMNLAFELLKKNNLNDSKVIDIFSLMTNIYNLPVISYDFGEEILGVFVDNIDKKFSFGYNTNNSYELNRVILSHMFGHYILSHKRKKLFVELNKNFFNLMIFNSSENNLSIQENEANIFMASLLINDKLFEIEMYKIGNTENMIYELAKIFCVPINVIQFKLMLTDF